MIIHSRAPVRLELGGGGTDIGPYDAARGGLVLNAAINKYSYTSLTANEKYSIKIISDNFGKSIEIFGADKITYGDEFDLLKAAVKRVGAKLGFEMRVRADLKVSSGLGGSASAAVSAIGALCEAFDVHMTHSEIAELAFKLEDEELKNVGGRQDQYAAAFGGFSLMEFKGGQNVKVNPVKLSADVLADLNKHLLLAYIGPRPASGDIVAGQRDSYTQEEKISLLDKMKDVTIQMHKHLKNGNVKEFGKLLSKEWELKTQMNPNITTEIIEKARSAANEAGALGSRVMGAGRGGHIIIYCDDNHESDIAKKLGEFNMPVVPYDFDFSGLHVWRKN